MNLKLGLGGHSRSLDMTLFDRSLWLTVNGQ